GYEDIGETIIFNIEERPTIVQVIVMEKRGVCSTGPKRISTVHSVDRNRRTRSWNEGDVRSIQEKGKYVIKVGIGKLVILLGCENIAEEQVATSRRKIELEDARIFSARQGV